MCARLMTRTPSCFCISAMRAMEGFHFCPVHLRPKMMFGVISVVEENPVIDFAVATHAPGDRFVRIGTVMTEVAVQITEAVPEVKKRQERKR